MKTSPARALGHAIAGACAIALSACASYGPGSLPPGATTAQIAGQLGPPTGQYTLPDGTRRLEYAKGPMGVHTYMLDLNADGSLKSWRQVLTEQQFAEVKPGMSQAEVLRMLGRPAEVRGSGLMKLTYWNYRYETFQCRLFGVDLDTSGRVVTAGYTRDPLCDDNRNVMD